jgi:pyruvate dehydrogenase (quinone)
MTQNVSEFVWKRLSEWGLSRVFGYPGDGVGGLDVALEKAKGYMHYVQVRHEEMAAFMASAHAKFTGEVGLCYATSGPGAIHLLTGLYDAKMDHMPVVASRRAKHLVPAISRKLIYKTCSKMWPPNM